MTGITKDELMQMAREYGMPFKALPDDYCDDMGLVRGVICSVDNVRFSCVEALVNAILERAAVECEKMQDRVVTAHGMVGVGYCVDSVRALKINTGD